VSKEGVFWKLANFEAVELSSFRNSTIGFEFCIVRVMSFGKVGYRYPSICL